MFDGSNSITPVIYNPFDGLTTGEVRLEGNYWDGGGTTSYSNDESTTNISVSQNYFNFKVNERSLGFISFDNAPTTLGEGQVYFQAIITAFVG